MERAGEAWAAARWWVVITGGGRWPQRLIHVAGLTATWRATPDGVRLSAANVVRAAHAAGIASVAIPLIGAGHGQLGPASALHAVHAGLDDVAELTRQLQIRIVVHPNEAGVLP